MPAFIIVGGQRCGTTSLYKYLAQHPCITSAFKKEVHFFDYNYHKGLAWYRSHFPSLLEKYCSKLIQGQDLITGEATPYYIFHPRAASRILQTLPQVKIIMMLRDPVDRAYSHYHHNLRLNDETLSSFEKAIETEQRRLEAEVEKMIRNKNYYSYNHQMYSYLSRGVYVDQVKRWRSLFSQEQILVIKSEDFFEDPASVFKQTLDFLNLPRFEPSEYRKYNAGHFPPMNSSTRKHLIDYFSPHNQRLYEYLGVNLGWDM